MNILIIDNSIAFTGAFKCAVNEADLLSEEHKFIFVISDQSKLKKTLQDKGIKVYRLPMVEIKRSVPILLLYPIMLLRNAVALRSIVRHEKVDIVQVNDFYNMLGVMLKVMGYKGKLLTYVRFLPSVMPGIFRKIWIRYGLKYSHRMIAVSDAVLKQLPPHPKAVRVYDPVQLTETEPEKTVRDNKDISILYLSNYIRGKGQDDALAAFIKVYATHKNITLTFMGGDMGLEKNAAYKSELEMMSARAGLTGIVKFDHFNANVESAIKAADIVLNCSEAESFSMTCLEAAYYGTALIATKCGGPEEIINNGKTGITVPVKDVDAIAEALTQLITNSELRSEFATKGRAYVREKFNTEQYRKEMRQIISNS
ncbi:MAG: glycosyltransferase family 4 protein [Chitinophagaceae bacterium]|nr:glycosyltransferase family 4 protein [Chitinophagaceae bacterium]MCB9045595.1 glycosyltransferase family 4 protein [Chitinophagales bacterium]